MKKPKPLSELEIQAIIQHLQSGDDVDAQLDDFDRLNENAGPQDLPILLQTLESEDAGFWVRELISETVLRIGGPPILPHVLRALEMNFKEGHDNDSLQTVLGDFAEENREEVMQVLDLLDSKRDNISAQTINWLSEFCEED